MNTEPIKNIKIDAVILWVDGNDEAYHSKLSPYLDEQPNATKSFNSRYVQVNEIEYSVKSILKYAPFVDTIFIVTDNQTPPFLKQNQHNDNYSKVKIVDHTVLFKGYESNLPTFNSRTIETCIHRIPELSEHFIYLNDDFFIINPTTQSDFFTEKGFPVLRGKWQKFDTKKKDKAGHKKAQDEAAKLLGFKKLFRFKHTPHPIRKSTLTEFFNENPEIFLENIKYKFRNKAQFLPVALANHLEIKNKTCRKQTDLQLLYFRSYKKPLFWYKFKLNINSKNKLFMGLQSLNKSPEHILNYITNWLTNRFN
ncbi:Stealth CR1 domain-containing protein [Winogradskyella pulchriflava]|uniref:Stealth CR1 domain-containing protein n=1 Tax=Winogradskyella pulchriflava TaxID=1110688 RepID=A0ABV6QAT0_9FLAO